MSFNYATGSVARVVMIFSNDQLQGSRDYWNIFFKVSNHVRQP